jgi:hypothetical protein
MAGIAGPYTTISCVFVRNRLAGALLRAQRQRVLVLARDLVILGDVFAGLPMASTPYCAFISGLMKRQPMVV